ncbi:MAG: DUF4249 domain-containing protein [Muribaculaceae bacterium]|nr:DUF4249 domain-containing protein [Muribaculaceae bacterium]
MALLKNLFLSLTSIFLMTGLSSCYQEFEPDIPSVPVLCMNSEITAGEPIILFLTRTWRWSEENQFSIDVDVTDAEVKLFVNGDLRETLDPGTIINEYYPSNPYPEIRKCFKGDYIPRSGDMIRIEASSPQYGDAWAEVRVPEEVPIDRIEIQDASCEAWGDTSTFPVVEEECNFNLRFRMLVYFTDRDTPGDYYDLALNASPYSDYDGEADAILYNAWPDFSGESLFSEHVSVLESAVAETSGYTIFSDRSINGKTYPLRIKFTDSMFIYKNPLDLDGPKEYGLVVSLRHVDEAYYKHVISLWETNDAIVGSLSGVGLANAVYPYSNVSTGAGVVAAYTSSKMTLPMADVVMAAQKKN